MLICLFDKLTFFLTFFSHEAQKFRYVLNIYISNEYITSSMAIDNAYPLIYESGYQLNRHTNTNGT